MTHRTIHKISRKTEKHWVGNGFYVSSMFSYSQDTGISPFLLLDYAGPTDFSPSDDGPRGVEQHPHRGFETVTIVYSGEVEHRDTAGNTGKIGPGDVQWMTAASGVLHEEKHSAAFTKKGGTLEMVQLWVNLPAKDKMSAPRYQEILNQSIPIVKLDDNQSQIRLIAGQFNGKDGAAKTFTPIHLYDICLAANSSLDIPINSGFNALLFVMNGDISIEGKSVQTNELAILENEGSIVSLKAHKETKLLFMSGEAIDEPVVGMGPFVMNTQEEIYQAYNDFRSGKFGQINRQD